MTVLCVYVTLAPLSTIIEVYPSRIVIAAESFKSRYVPTADIELVDRLIWNSLLLFLTRGTQLSRESGSLIASCPSHERSLAKASLISSELQPSSPFDRSLTTTLREPPSGSNLLNHITYGNHNVVH